MLKLYIYGTELKSVQKYSNKQYIQYTLLLITELKSVISLNE